MRRRKGSVVLWRRTLLLLCRGVGPGRRVGKGRKWKGIGTSGEHCRYYGLKRSERWRPALEAARTRLECGFQLPSKVIQSLPNAQTTATNPFQFLYPTLALFVIPPAAFVTFSPFSHPCRANADPQAQSRSQLSSASRLLSWSRPGKRTNLQWLILQIGQKRGVTTTPSVCAVRHAQRGCEQLDSLAYKHST